MTDAAADATTLDRRVQWLIIALAELSAVLLLVLHEGADGAVVGGADPALRLLLNTLAIIPPLLLALSVESLRDRLLFIAVGALTGVLAGLAWHVGTDIGTSRWGGTVSGPYWKSLAVAMFVLLPFLQAWRDAGTRWPLRLPYGRLYHHAWDNALALAGAAAFTGAAWAVLWLWGALFAVIGIDAFKALFELPRFGYPVSGLLVGFGLVISRGQPGALRALLRLCFGLARALLPAVMLLSLLFLAVVTLRGPDALWQTHRAASLLLWLLLFGVVLTNGVHQDGGAEARYPRGLRTLVSAGLLSLPVHAALALWAIALRVGQHGWTPDRLTGLLVAVILALHAVLLAWAALPARDGRWLARLSTGNPLLAGVVVVLLLASQSPWLDFRAITVRSQLARLARGELRLDHPDRCHAAEASVTPPCLDLGLFADQLGEPGRQVLRALMPDPRVRGDADLREWIELALDRESAKASKPHPFIAAAVLVRPAGIPLPDGLFAAVAADLASDGGRSPDCRPTLHPCVLIAVDLGGPDGTEWLFVPPDDAPAPPPLVYGRTAEGHWQLMAWVSERFHGGEAGALQASELLQHMPVGVPGRWWLLQLGEQQYPVIDGRPPGLQR